MCAQNEKAHGDVHQVIVGLEDLDRSKLAHLEQEIKRRLRQLGADGGGGERPVSGIVEYRPHADVTLQAEVRRYYQKDSSAKEQGPYWYCRYPRAASRRRSTWAVPIIRRATWRGNAKGKECSDDCAQEGQQRGKKTAATTERPLLRSAGMVTL